VKTGLVPHLEKGSEGDLERKEESIMPDLIRHPEDVPTKVGSHLKDRIPLLAGRGFHWEPFITAGVYPLLQYGAGMNRLLQNWDQLQLRRNSLP